MTPSERLIKRLKQGRAEEGMSQFELGVKAGIDEATAKSRVSHYETGLNAPPLSVVKQLAKALNKPMAFFFCENDEVELLTGLYKLSKAKRSEKLKEFLQSLPD